jgi:D-glycero-alpha-D-manno-heptose-7-phosphate kinase
VLEEHRIGPSLEIVSLADIPAGTGLGSSGAFTVGLLRAVYAWKREHVTAGDLAEEACRVEIERLGRPVGKQDQYIAAFGGITCFEFLGDGRVHVSPLSIPTSTMHELEERLLMFFTGSSRTADELLGDQQRRTEQGDEAMIEGLQRVEELGLRIRDVLEAGDAASFGALMHEHWLEKRERSPGMSSADIDRWYDVGLANGAVGGKLTGAGGGGFLLFLAEDPAALRAAMEAQGLAEVRFAFDHDGSTIVVRA